MPSVLEMTEQEKEPLSRGEPGRHGEPLDPRVDHNEVKPPEGPLSGVTVRAHVNRLMWDVDERIRTSFAQIRSGQKLRPKVREQLSRALSGAIGDLESIRLWLDAGAPE
jgi:hypothetical protein